MSKNTQHRDDVTAGLETFPIAADIELAIRTFGDGDGPSVLIMGGVHGDEAEGPLIAARIIRRLAKERVCGTVHIIAIANPPAFQAGTRFSPDGGNLNRAFPGDPEGTPTERIADIIERHFLSKVDLVIDFHTGGSAITYLPTAVIPVSAWAHDRDTHVKLLSWFGFPTFLYDPGDDDPSSVIGTCGRLGCLILSTELGGGAGVSYATIEKATTGVLTVLFGMGLLGGVPDSNPTDMPAIVLRRRVDQSPKAQSPGIFEPKVSPGDWVQDGDILGFIHSPEELIESPTVVHADCDGLVLCIRARVRTESGDVLAKLGTPIESSSGRGVLA